MRAWHVVGTLADARWMAAVVSAAVISSIRHERRRDKKMDPYIAFESKNVYGAPGV